MTGKKSEDVAMLTSEEDGSWSLRHTSYRKIHSNHARLLDALYAREVVLSGVSPPYGRWYCVNNFPEDLEFFSSGIYSQLQVPLAHKPWEIYVHGVLIQQFQRPFLVWFGHA